ncbi:MAG: transposase [Candidatus Binataceae bacterium]
MPVLTFVERVEADWRSVFVKNVGYGPGLNIVRKIVKNGRLKIDNNGAEQALRPIVLGRKNWLFAGSEAAAHRTAILCSLVQTCKHLQINPFVYLRDVIERVSTHPARLVLELTPREWKRPRLDSGAQTAA